MDYLGLFVVRSAAETFGCLVLLDEEPYRLEKGGVADEFMLPLDLRRPMGDGGIRCRTGRGVMEINISQRQLFLFLSFRGHNVPPPDHSHMRLVL